MMDRSFAVRALVKDESLRIKDIVKQTGYDKGHVSRLRKASRIDKLIADAVAAEREACAKVCDDKAMHCKTKAQEAIDAGEHDEVSAIRSTAWQISVCAAAIRARGNT